MFRFLVHRLLIAFLLFSGIKFSFAQKRSIDSLIHLLPGKKQDTSYVKILVNLASEGAHTGDFNISLRYGKQAVELSDKLGYKIGKANAMLDMGLTYYYEGKYDSAKYLFETSMKIREELGDKAGLAKSFVNLGLIELNKGNQTAALEAMQKGLKLNEELGSKEGIANSYINIGSLYYYAGNLNGTLDCMLKALKINEEIGEREGINSCLNNIGVIYAEQKNYQKALEYFEKALKLNIEIGNKTGIATEYSNIGGIHLANAEYDKALTYFLKTLEMAKGLGLQHSTAETYDNIAGLYVTKGNFDEAIRYANEAVSIFETLNEPQDYSHSLNTLADAYYQKGENDKALKYSEKSVALAHQINSMNSVQKTEITLSKILEKAGRIPEAFEHYKTYITARDSMYSEEKNKEITQKTMTYEFDKVLAQKKAEQEKAELQHKAEQRQQYVITVSVIAGLILMILFSFFLYKRFRITQRQKQIIESQKKTVEEKSMQLEEKNKEIVDSITYAKRLQEAILPPEKLIQNSFSDFFILYKPKAIVAGDFYWLENNEDYIFFAAGDCTGHGVPGAMVSVVCSNALNRAVKEFNITDAGKILDKTRELVLDTFSRSDTDVKDGMDISLVVINRNNENGKTRLNWAGANNPLWYFRQGNFSEILPNKQPIGKTDKPEPFNSHAIELEKGDCFYLLTDGYADQFGGEKGKKLKQKSLKELISSCSEKAMPEQMNLLSNYFEIWRGNLEQVDDVTILGVRV